MCIEEALRAKKKAFGLFLLCICVSETVSFVSRESIREIPAGKLPEISDGLQSYKAKYSLHEGHHML